VPNPTTSSYAVLSLLALRPWSGYELTNQATRSLRFAWPKSERLLYSEPKKLVELGWATTHTERVGQRTRNVYEITDAGRAALTEWMTTRPQPAQLEAEALLRILFADYGTTADAHNSLAALASDAAELQDQVVQLMSSYRNIGHPFPDRIHLSVLFATFQVELFALMQRWSQFAANEIDQWEGRTADVGWTDRVDEMIDAITEHRSLIDAQPPRPPHTNGAPTIEHRPAGSH
jgi:DNA-binding PadR family transcriptional regulator